MSDRPLETRRFVLVALLVGLAWFALIRSLGSLLPEPWSFYGEYDGIAQGLVALSFAVGVLVPAWFFRRAFPALTRAETFAAAGLALPILVVCFTAVNFSWELVWGIEEVREEPSLLGKAGWCFLIVMMYSVAGIAAAVQTFYVFLPLSWLSISCLRWASGAPVARAEYTISARRRLRHPRQHAPDRLG